MPATVNCPTCQSQVVWQASNPHRPFCSKKCQLIDLGEWADEQKTIPCERESDAGLHAFPGGEDLDLGAFNKH